MLICLTNITTKAGILARSIRITPGNISMDAYSATTCSFRKSILSACCLLYLAVSGQDVADIVMNAATGSHCKATTPDGVGPFYVDGAPVVYLSDIPKEVNVCAVTDGSNLVILSGTVKFVRPDRPCGVPGRAVLDIWQSNVTGLYSQVDIALQQNPRPHKPGQKPKFPEPGPFTLESKASHVDLDWGCRLKIVTDDNGRYSIVTEEPGRYKVEGKFRPAHIHVRVTPVDRNNSPLGDTFTTQLYFHKDKFFPPHDPCADCKGGDPTVTVRYRSDDDFKTLVGRLDFLIDDAAVIY